VVGLPHLIPTVRQEVTVGVGRQVLLVGVGQELLVQEALT
jgi:hypothetical protein